MNRKVLAAIFGVFLALSALMSMYSMLTLPGPVEFSASDFHSPGRFDSPGLQPMPTVTGDWIHSPDVSVLISMGKIYTNYGGSVRIEIRNNGTRTMFLEKAAFQWTASGQRAEMDVHRFINASETWRIKTMAIPGPSISGSMNYRLSISLLMFRNNGWYRIINGIDNWIDFSEHSLDVLDMPVDHEYAVEHNARLYYERVNQLVDFGSVKVAGAAGNATAGLGTGYNIGKVCAIFDYLDSNIVYTEDPGGDKWYSPDQTLNSLKGDCEDYAMLITAMVDDIGGTSRVYLTKDHAFAAVYVGNTSAEFQAARAGIRAYYGTDVQVHAMVDETGYWLNVDPLGSFYAGGFAVGQAPTGANGGMWNSTFEGSNIIHAIDVTGLDIGVPMWLEPNFWMGMMLVFGFITVSMILWAGGETAPQKTICHICAGEVEKRDLYVCPGCQTTYHRKCAFGQPHCMTCRAPIQFPPPPPV